MKLSPQSICEQILQKKYCKGDESTIEEVQARVAKALAAVEGEPGRWEPTFWAALQQGMVLAGRINAAAGTELLSTSMNCSVLPIGDSIAGVDEEGYPGIYDTLTDATITMRLGGGVGFDFSRIRPCGSHVSGTDSEASGPLSYMEVFDKSCEKVESAGSRRGAQMGILRVDHPDILEFVHAKDRKGAFEFFNFSVAVTDAFMEAVRDDQTIPLVHRKPPGRSRQSEYVTQRSDGLWVYETIRARDIWKAIMVSTYDHGEPGVFFIDSVNEANNLYYCEHIEACNPCGEQGLPSYGSCCLGSINLTRFVQKPFSEDASFHYGAFGSVVHAGVRMLDNVLETTNWPLHKQREEALAKRRVGLGFLGLGSALVMLGIPYNSVEGREVAKNIAIALRDRSYTASVELAIERGPFPLFDEEKYLQSAFTKNLPNRVRAAIREHGIRNSHLTSVAPTGTISLAYADNASNGIEPVFAWYGNRRVRDGKGGYDKSALYDHAYRLWKLHADQEGRPDKEVIAGLPSYFVHARDISALDHARMVTEVQPYIDASISKTVNIPRDYAFVDFEDLYTWAWSNGAKSLATFRPNEVMESILSDATNDEKTVRRHHLDTSDPDRRVVIHKPSVPTLDCLRWPGRPVLPDGNNSKCYRVKHPKGANFALFIGEIDNNGADTGVPIPFEVWVNAVESPRGLEALAINLSYDLYANDRGWLKKKLMSLMRCETDGEGFPFPMPPDGKSQYAPSLVAAVAMLIDYRCTELGAFDGLSADLDSEAHTPVLDALMNPKEPKAGPDGTMSWTVDVLNHSTGDDFVLGLKEAVIDVDGSQQLRPYSIWLSNTYPRALDGLCKALSLDMRVVDPAWVGKKLRELLNFAEPKGDFWATIPGKQKKQVYPSTVAYIARLVIHRFAMLGLLDNQGYPVAPMGTVESPAPLRAVGARSVGAMEAARGKLCRGCGELAVIRRDGCDYCTQCDDFDNCG